MLRYTAVVASCLAICALAGEHETDMATLIAAAKGQRDANVREVRSIRDSAVRNPRWPTGAITHATMIASGDGRKRYELFSTNAEGIRRTILVKILDGVEFLREISRVRWRWRSR